MRSIVLLRQAARLTLGACCAAASAGLQAAPDPSWAQDVAGGQDHPLVRRFRDAWLTAYQQQAFASTEFPGRLGLDNNRFAAPVTVEGRITRLVYLAPLGKTPLEVFRNHAQALQGAGFKPLVSCTPSVRECGTQRFALAARYEAMTEADFAANWQRQPTGSVLQQQMRGLGGTNMLGTEDLSFSYGTLPTAGGTVHVLLHTGTIYRTQFTATYLEIVEPQLMASGQVTVDAQAMMSGLQADGRIALYGIHFDTNKAVLKPASQPQIEQMAQLLKAQPALKVHLVGHTDNQGDLAFNLGLSQQRAQAVRDALVQQHQIDPRRLDARGVASLAPVASNAQDNGRARNRRVELVLQ